MSYGMASLKRALACVLAALFLVASDAVAQGETIEEYQAKLIGITQGEFVAVFNATSQAIGLPTAINMATAVAGQGRESNKLPISKFNSITLDRPAASPPGAIHSAYYFAQGTGNEGVDSLNVLSGIAFVTAATPEMEANDRGALIERMGLTDEILEKKGLTNDLETIGERQFESIITNNGKIITISIEVTPAEEDDDE